MCRSEPILVFSRDFTPIKTHLSAGGLNIPEMDYINASNLFCSEVVDSQLTAIRFVYSQLLLGKLPSEDFLQVLIERGLSCEKSALVRELSFRCVHQLYTFKVVHWSEVRAAVVTEMGTAESTGCLSAALAVLAVLPDSLLVTFVGAKDRFSLPPSTCLSSNALLTYIHVYCFVCLHLLAVCPRSSLAASPKTCFSAPPL